MKEETKRDEEIGGSGNTEEREKGGNVEKGEREVALVEKGLYEGRRAQINDEMIGRGGTDEEYGLLGLGHLMTWIRKSVGLENCKHT